MTSPAVKNKRLPLWTLGGAYQLFAALLWIPQSWVLAQAVYGMMQQTHAVEIAIRSALIFIALGLLRTVLNAMGSRRSYLKAREALTKMRQEALNALCVRSPLDVQGVTSGMAASVLTEQAEAVVPYLSRYQPVQLRVMVVPWVMAAFVAYHSWLAACILLFAAPLIPLFMALVGYGAQKASENQIIEIGQMNSFLLDRIRGLSTIRAFDAVDVVATRFRQVSENVKHKTMKVLSVAFLSSAVMELFSALGVALVAAYIGLHLLGMDLLQFGVTGGGKMTLEQGMFILLLAPTFFDPLRDLSSVWHDRASGVAAMDALKQMSQQGMRLVGGEPIANDTTDTKTVAETIQRGEQARKDTGAKGVCVELKEVCFAYGTGEANVVQNFSLQVKQGEKVALVAPSGYGKSTLLALIAGLVASNSGEVYIDGEALNNQTADRLRQRMGWISQSPHVFSGTLLENITLGRKEVSQEDVMRAVEASAFTSVASDQFNRRLGEGSGAGISGGEVLRLALTRAMASPRLGLLLADEPTAHLDASTAQAVTEGMMAVASQGVTLVIATHDERLLPYMDRVIRLDALFAGQSIEEGACDEE